MTLRPALVTLVAGLLIAVGGTVTAQSHRDAALSFTGEIYVARSGTCGELLAHCSTEGADNPILAVDLLRPGEPQSRLLVPGSGGPEAEGVPALLFEDASNSLFVFWEGKIQPHQSRVNLAWLEEGEWSEVVEVSGDASPLKGTPQVAVTRDMFQVTDPEGESTSHVRTVLHVSWWEQGAGAEEVYYTPIILEDGIYAGVNQVYNLSRFDPNPPSEVPGDLSPELSRSPKIELGRDESTVVIGFVNPTSERFISFEMRVLPGELSTLGEDLYAYLLAQEGSYDPQDPQELGNRARGHLIEIGHRLHPVMRTYLADEIQRILSADGDLPGELRDLANRARGHLIEIGARLLGDGGFASTDPPLVSKLLEVRPVREGSPSAASFAHAVYLQMVADRPAPQVGPGPVSIYLSEDARQALVSWQRPEALLYRETRGEGWTAPRRLELEGTLDAARAEQILRRRVRER